MLEAAFWGAVAGSSLIVGALVALIGSPRPRVVGMIMAFGVGTLIAAVSYDLIGASIAEDDSAGVALGLLLGATTFLLGDWYVSSRGAHSRKRLDAPAAAEAAVDDDAEESGTAILIGTVLDGVPESFALGLSLIEGGETAVGLIIAVFISNVPEAIGGTASLVRTGWNKSRIMVMWSAIALMTALSSMLGYAFFEARSGLTGARVQAFAAGAIIAMLTTTMVPEAHRLSGRVVGVITTFGFALGVGMTAW